MPEQWKKHITVHDRTGKVFHLPLCNQCGRFVGRNDELTCEGKVCHKNCFRCGRCQRNMCGNPDVMMYRDKPHHRECALGIRAGPPVQQMLPPRRDPFFEFFDQDPYAYDPRVFSNFSRQNPRPYGYGDAAFYGDGYGDYPYGNGLPYRDDYDYGFDDGYGEGYEDGFGYGYEEGMYGMYDQEAYPYTGGRMGYGDRTGYGYGASYF